MKDPGNFVQELMRLRRLVAAAMLGKLPEASGEFDRTRLDAKIFDEAIQIRGLMLRLLRPPVAPGARPPRDEEQAGGLEARVLSVLGELQQFVLEHPVAAQKIFSALVAEGRRYASTKEGGARARALASLPAMARARKFWESSLAGVLEEGGEGVLPSSYVEIVIQSGRLKAPEALLAKIPVLTTEPVR